MMNEERKEEKTEREKTRTRMRTRTRATRARARTTKTFPTSGFAARDLDKEWINLLHLLIANAEMVKSDCSALLWPEKRTNMQLLLS